MIFIDSGAFLARTLNRDEHHAAALAAWPGLQRERCFTSSLVLAEVFTLLARRAGASTAIAVGQRVYADPAVRILRATREQELAALDLMRNYADQRIGYVDCVSFVLMRAEGVSRAFTYDRHFRAAGFELWAGGS